MKNLLFVSLFLAAIGTNAQNTADSIPDWFNNPPVSTKMFYGVGAGTSRSMDIAEKKAILSANLQIAEQAEPVKVKEIKIKSKSADGKTTEDIIQREIVNAILTEVKMIKKAYTQSDDKFTVYVMVEMKKKR